MNQTVLVVDDDSLNREIVTAFLEKQGVMVREVDNGETAVEMIAKEPFDMVFMDVEMPVTDGYEATRRIRRLASPWATNLPIVALTGHAFTEFRDKRFEAGMNDHMEKPVKPERIREMVQKWLTGPKKGQKTEREKPRVLAAKSFSVEDQVRAKRQFSETKVKEEISSVNVQEGLSYVNHNRRMYAKLLNKFVKAYSDTGGHLFESVESGNFTEAVHQLHKIKSIAAMIGAGELSSKAGELEGLFKDLENREPIETNRAGFPEDSDRFFRVRKKPTRLLKCCKTFWPNHTG